MQRKILTLIHKETSIPGLIGQKLESMGYQLDIRAPVLGDLLPQSIDDYAGMLVFGGPMSVNDNEAYLHQEIEWIRRALAAELPYLGICLGAQLLAKVLGATVGPHAAAVEEIGYYPIYATEAGRSHFPDKMMVYHWHTEGFELPDGAVLIATGDDFHQAFRWGRHAYGLQFHPEITADMVDFWSTNGAELIGAPNTQTKQQQIDNHRHHSQSVDRWLETFLNNWLSSVPEPA
ncbi:gamma-glutamyl-gamma-aminobutyrate hydrolase family protein [cf. Phormidesmis sp. LEGE 11477]|uniref:glutamine amidotransferase-related protein n=1 Tax=cf. Phormidesmis sp. LEGE 11477 TaxID=1828680 RepID=UPI001882AE2A|nr:gamma-glutamyl-gamma-aminobutyrate hydrolase family protein [cf. Phormidesmis sp. LEGE 11477]MBE9063819.1 gamma-glutamyl-gamma-aminobutyrate hydrolase family protein [cf. Phormidesmis sp. LEGE 11477]